LPASKAAAIGLTRSGLAICHPGGGGDRGDPAQPLGEHAGDGVGAVMAAEQGHRDRAVLGERDDRRFGALVVEQRRHRADQNAGGAHPDDRPAAGEQRGEMRHRAVVALVPLARKMPRPMQPRIRQQVPRPPCQRRPAGAEHDDRGAARRRPAHRANPPPRTSAVAK
jgi:hypothetical protein